MAGRLRRVSDQTKASRQLNSLELFTGGGGLALGTERAGFRHLALVERDSDSCATLRHNRPEWPVFDADARTFDYKPYADKIDLLAGGAPCQPFSLGGKHAGQHDDRNLFPEIVRAVRDLRPKAFLLENVRGLTRESFLPYFHYIIAQLKQPTVLPKRGEDWFRHHERLGRTRSDELTYDVSFGVVNAADYGVPQLRHRVIIVGFQHDLDVAWRWPEPTHSEESLLVSQRATNSYWLDHDLVAPELSEKNPLRPHLGEGTTRWLTVRDALVGLPCPKKGECSAIANHVFVPGARPYKGHTGSQLDRPAKTLKAGDHGVPGGENTLTDESGEFRYLTVRESARVQTFPDDWTFVSSRTEAMRQIGNAVPVTLARVFASAVSTELVRAGNRTLVLA